MRVFPHHALRARGRRRTPGQMNKVERAYADRLEMLKRAGEVAWYGYEAVTFKLAPDTRYTPDYLVMLADGTLECVDCKGGKVNKKTGERSFWCEEDSKLKVKVAATLLPFLSFVFVYPLDKTGLSWGRKDFEP